MSNMIKIDENTVKRSQAAFKTLESNINNEKTEQTILNSRRQALYDMNYSEWASNSIAIMASYTVLLLIILISVIGLYYYGNTIKQQFKKLMSESSNITE